MANQTVVSTEIQIPPTLEEDRERIVEEFRRVIFRALKHRAIQKRVEKSATNPELEPIVVVFTHVNRDELNRTKRLHDPRFDKLAKAIDKVCVDHSLPAYTQAMRSLIQAQTRYPNLKVGYVVASRQRGFKSYDDTHITPSDRLLLRSLRIAAD